MIEFQKVSVCYAPSARHPIHAIEKIDLTIDDGEWVFLVGPSGAGKSTLLKLLHCGLHAPARIDGRVKMNGRDITHLSGRDVPLLRRKIGVVFQDFQLLAQKTAWENVAFALRVIGVPQSRIAREVPRALDTVNLAHKAHSQPHELSGGEQQRVAIARAIVNNPSLLLADEPTGNLDPQTAQEISEVLERINKELGTTVVMATHDRLLVDRLKKRVVRVREGCIASDEATGVYHPEDDEPAPRALSTQSEAAAEEVSEDSLEGLLENFHDAAPRERVSTRRRVQLEADETISGESMSSEAPVGSSENPIVSYSRK